LVLNTRQLLYSIVWLAATFALSGGLALAVYVRFRSARLAREAFNAAELERVGASREVLASRLAAMQARIEPRFLLGTLAQVEALYERDPQAGDRMLDGLIAYLHAALPQLRSQRSTLKQEVQLAESYLRIMQIRMGSRLELRVDVPPDLGNCDFPPMMLLPLTEDALRNGLEPWPHGGTIAITADVAGDRLRVRVSDDGLPRTTASNDGSATNTLSERLRGLYGTTASLEVTVNEPQGVIAAIEVPLATARNHR
jgi:LytS/YehU family sensor histidine kinase